MRTRMLAQFDERMKERERTRPTPTHSPDKRVERWWELLLLPLRYQIGLTKTGLNRACASKGADHSLAVAYREYRNCLEDLHTKLMTLHQNNLELTPRHVAEELAKQGKHIEQWSEWTHWARALMPNKVARIRAAFAAVPTPPRTRPPAEPFVYKPLPATLAWRVRGEIEQIEKAKALGEAKAAGSKPTLENVVATFQPREKTKPHIPDDVRALWGDATPVPTTPKPVPSTGGGFVVPGFEDDADLRMKAQQTKEHDDDDK